MSLSSLIATDYFQPFLAFTVTHLLPLIPATQPLPYTLTLSTSLCPACNSYSFVFTLCSATQYPVFNFFVFFLTFNNQIVFEVFIFFFICISYKLFIILGMTAFLLPTMMFLVPSAPCCHLGLITWPWTKLKISILYFLSSHIEINISLAVYACHWYDAILPSVRIPIKKVNRKCQHMNDLMNTYHFTWLETWPLPPAPDVMPLP